MSVEDHLILVAVTLSSHLDVGKPGKIIIIHNKYIIENIIVSITKQICRTVIGINHSWSYVAV